MPLGRKMASARRNLPLAREERDLVIGASKRFVVAFDNLSGLPHGMSDALCRLTDGGGFSTRTLYSDDGETIFSASRPVMLAGVEDIVGKSDLSDRTSSLTLAFISEAQRKTAGDKQDLITAALEADLVAQTVLHLMKETKGHWRGTATELLPLLRGYISDEQAKGYSRGL
jgi:hypothetical protein